MKRCWSLSLVISVVLLVLAGLAAAVSPSKALLTENVPHVRQKPDFCGEACVAMWLQKLGRKVDQDWVHDQSGLDARKDLGHARGCRTGELARALTAIGFKTGPVWHKVRTDHAAGELEALWRGLKGDLVKGMPSIVCMRYGDGTKTTEHFRLVLGCDDGKGEVIYHEPAEANGAYRRMKRSLFLKLWPLKYNAKEWTVIRLRLEAGRLKAGAVATAPTAADYAQHLMKLKRRIPTTDFHIVVQPPFVVIGDESPATVKRRSLRTIKWAADSIKKLYFKKDPDTILDIWLFKDAKSYRKHTKLIFNDKPDTAFGYFSHQHNALIMNIATGGGTLVHEIVHPFMHANFPQCPSWFDEGLASLYEQCGKQNGRIWGYTNWRLAGLQKAIRAGKVPRFKELCSTTRFQFYKMDKGTNYGQARYLCYYLQHNGLLAKFYHAFHKSHKKDPTGYRTLLTILGKEESQMAAWQKEWEKWVLRLKFPQPILSSVGHERRSQ